MSRGNALYVQSLAKGFALLEAFSQRPAPLTLDELAEGAGLDRSTTQRMAHTLVSLGYLERGVNGRGFSPGKRILDRSFDYMRSVPLLERATPLLFELQNDSGERVELSLHDDTTIVFALRRQIRRQNYTVTLAGRRLSIAHTAGGRSIMAHLDDAATQDLIARADRAPMTSRTITDTDVIRDLVRVAHTDGYALSVEENMLGELNIASAIVNAEGMPVAAVHVSGSLSEWTPDAFKARFAPRVIETARALGGRSGTS